MCVDVFLCWVSCTKAMCTSFLCRMWARFTMDVDIPEMLTCRMLSAFFCSCGCCCCCCCVGVCVCWSEVTFDPRLRRLTISSMDWTRSRHLVRCSWRTGRGSRHQRNTMRITNIICHVIKMLGCLWRFLPTQDYSLYSLVLWSLAQAVAGMLARVSFLKAPLLATF